MRKTPIGWKQAQAAVGNMQATLYGQIRVLKLDLKQRYEFTFVHLAGSLVRRAQRLVNRYLEKACGLAAYEKRWNKKYFGSLCNFGGTVQFRKPGVPKAEPSCILGIWLGRCTESDVHFVADASCVFKTRSVRRLVPGISMAGRFGTSRKTKHVSLRYLYMQELATSGLVKLKNTLRTLNAAHIMTKDVSKDILFRHLPTFGLAH